MKHPKRLPVSQLFRMLEEQLQTPQHVVVAHFGLTRQAVNNWAKGMSLPRRYREAFITFVADKLRDAVAVAAQAPPPTQRLLALSPLDEVRQNLNTALLQWQDECFEDRGGLSRIWRESLDVVNRYGKDLAMIPAPGPADLEEAVRQLGRVLRTRNRLATEPSMPLRERWAQAVGHLDPEDVLWQIYRRLTNDEQDGAHSGEP